MALTVQDRGYLLWKFADLIEKNADDLARIEALVSLPTQHTWLQIDASRLARVSCFPHLSIMD